MIHMEWLRKYNLIIKVRFFQHGFKSGTCNVRRVATVLPLHLEVLILYEISIIAFLVENWVHVEMLC